MRVALWDTCRNRLEGCFSTLPEIECESLLGRLGRYTLRQLFPLQRQPVALELAYLAAILRRLRHTLEYVEDDVAAGADLYLFRPTLGALDAAVDAMAEARRLAPRARLVALGPVASRWPELFTAHGVTVLKGEVEQLRVNLDAVLCCDKPIVHVGFVEDPDSLPWPEWSWFECQRFRLPGDFHGFPVALVQHSRAVGGHPGASAQVRQLCYRPAERVVSEMRHQIETHGFEAFRFCDPAFGADAARTWQLVKLLRRLPRAIEFSVHSRPSDLADDLLEAAAAAGLAMVHFDVRLPSHRGDENLPGASPLQSYCRLAERARTLGVRTLARIHLPLADDPPSQLIEAMRWAAMMNTTYIELAFMPQSDFKPVGDRPERCGMNVCNPYYLRWKYWSQHLRLLLPSIEPRAVASLSPAMSSADAAHPHTPKPLGGVEIIQRTRGLRKDSPHQRSVMRRASNPHQQD